VESGETLGTIADEFDTTVESLVELNPGVDPTALTVGQRIRVR
jgi:LysM repeat protein